MKLLRLLLVVMGAVLITFALSGNTLAFHDDGSAHCDGCHSMHNSQDGAEVYVGTGEYGGYLMKAQDPSSTCLTCHAEYGQLTVGGSGYGSGGDFYWLTKDYTWSAHGHGYESTGDSHGHNIIAGAYDLTLPDQTLAYAPGSNNTISSDNLGCESCHDPHGKAGTELLLYNAGATTDTGPVFTANAPILSSPGRSTASYNAVSDGNHTAFGSGASEWCANCHFEFLSGDQMHPVSQNMGSSKVTRYNAYLSTSSPTGNTQATSYWEAVPFESGETDKDALEAARETLDGPTGASSQVMCMSCHRAHASAFPDSGRWYFGATYIVEDSHPLITDTGADANDVTNKYYGKVWENTQRSLCNKCHMRDNPSDPGP